MSGNLILCRLGLFSSNLPLWWEKPISGKLSEERHTYFSANLKNDLKSFPASSFFALCMKLLENSKVFKGNCMKPHL